MRGCQCLGFNSSAFDSLPAIGAMLDEGAGLDMGAMVPLRAAMVWAVASGATLIAQANVKADARCREI
jgi:hypothetical protein